METSKEALDTDSLSPEEQERLDAIAAINTGPAPGEIQTTDEGEWDENNPERAAVLAAAEKREGQELTETTKMDATAWFMSEEPEETIAFRRLEINVSADPDRIIEVEWVVKALTRERITQIREEAATSTAGRRRARRDENMTGDTALANARIAAEGTLSPDLRDPKVRGQFTDPVDALKHRFKHKPGLIDQICGHVIEVTGYNDEDVREIEAAKN